MDSCSLATTGGNLYLIIIAASIAIIFGIGFMIKRHYHAGKGLFGVLFITGMLLASMIQPIAPAFAEAGGCVAVPDSSTGKQGQLQTFNVLANDTPESGSTFILSTLL